MQIDESRAIVFGGQKEAYDSLVSTEILDLQAGTFSLGPTMSEQRAGAVAAAL